MAQQKRSTAQVVKLLTNYGEPLLVDDGEEANYGEFVQKFVLNLGTTSGATVGDKYLVYSLGDEVADPQTGASLGRLEIVRGRARIIHVQDNLSICESTETKTVRRRDPFNPIGSGEIEQVQEGLRVLKIGDFARPV